MKGFFKGMAAVVFGGMGCFTAIVFAVVLMVVLSVAALGNALPAPLQPMFWRWVAGGNTATDVMPTFLSVGWKVPYTGYKGPTSFVCEVPPSGATLTDCFGVHRLGGWIHHGIDYGVPVGTPVRTPMGGKVVFAGWSAVGYGNLVVIENDGYQVFLAHNSRFNVQVGQIVTAGQVVAWSGNTGNSTGPHVHFEVRRVSKQGAEAVDPTSVYLPGQSSYCDWYHIVPANDYETKGCEKYH